LAPPNSRTDTIVAAITTAGVTLPRFLIGTGTISRRTCVARNAVRLDGSIRDSIGPKSSTSKRASAPRRVSQGRTAEADSHRLLPPMTGQVGRDGPALLGHRSCRSGPISRLKIEVVKIEVAQIFHSIITCLHWPWGSLARVKTKKEKS
jgi:hypothetical protein